MNLDRSLDEMSLRQHDQLLSINRLQLELDQLKQSRTEPIAVIGIGCRFPGGSNSPQEFWQMLAEGRDAIQDGAPDRYDIDEFYHPDIKMPGKTVSRWGSFIDNIDQFDAPFFGISPREAMFIDPQQRVLLEVTWEALERAGLPPGEMAGTSTGVYVGIFNKDYSDGFTESMVSDRAASANAYMGTGSSHSFAAGRISYLLGLQGPAMAVDTVCSSSLVAVHLACQSLRNNECEIALAGAVDLTCHPIDAIITSKMRCLSPTGKCRTFDANADGFVRGEGCGVLVLKRRSRAMADGDNILALIRGSAVNHDGRSKGMLAPNGMAQEAVLTQALHNAGVSPDKISYIEAHGTGTKLGDPIEFQALKNVIGRAHDPEKSVCMVGSVKTNVGHLLAAAGMAGLVKTIMCMQHKAIPPHLHLKTLNSHINLEGTPFVIPRHLSQWNVASGPRFAGVSACGLSGTNAHIVLQEVNSEAKVVDNEQPSNSQHINGKTQIKTSWLLPISAKNVDGLRQLARTWFKELQPPDGQLSDVDMGDICFTASLRRTHYDQHRLALVGDSHGDFTMQLEAFLHEKMSASGMSNGSKVKDFEMNVHRPVFVFSGQGAQWAGMGQELFNREKIFRTTLEKCDFLLRSHVSDSSWSLLEELQAEEAQSRLHETAIAQAAMFSMQVALCELWRSWGIEPAAVVGHSVGEITAAYVAGALDLEDAICVVAQRGMFMQQDQGLGAMAAVEISETEALEFLEENHIDNVAIAAVNSPTSVVLSGETKALNEVLDKIMLQKTIQARKLNVVSAFHSPQMERLRIPLVENLNGIKPKSCSMILLSSVTGAPSSGEDLDAKYWGRNMCEPVRFDRAMENLIGMGFSTFLEISPHPVLSRSVKQNLAHHHRSGLVLPSLRRGIGEQKSMLTSIGELYTRGYAVKWDQFFPSQHGDSKPHHDHHYKVVPMLPTYPWQRKRCWFPDTKPLSSPSPSPSPSLEGKIAPSPTRRSTTGHPLLAKRVRSATRDCIFETTISTEAYPWLADHKTSGMTVFPASAYIEMMHESVRLAKLNDGVVRLRDLYVHQALTLLSGQERVVQLVLQSTADNPAGEIQILSCGPDNDENADLEWTLHASGYYRPDRQPASVVGKVADSHTNLNILRGHFSQHMEGWEYYQRMQKSGLEYGPAFQGLKQIWWKEGEALGQLCLPQELVSEMGFYFIHPAFLDSCIHTAAAAVSSDHRGQDSDQELYLPLNMDGVYFYQRPGNEVWVHVKVSKRDLKHGQIVAHVHILSEGGDPVGFVDGLHLRRASRSALTKERRNYAPSHWLYKLQWDLKAHQEGKEVSSGSLTSRSWLIFCDRNGIGTQLAKALVARGEQCFQILASDQRYEQTHLESLEPNIHTINPSDPQQFQRFLEECVPLLRNSHCSVIHLWALDTVRNSEETLELDLLQSEQQRLCGSLLHLVQAMVQRCWATSPQLWVVTQNSQDVSGMCAWEAHTSSVVQSPLWGLGRVIALEHPDLDCRLIDLPSSDQLKSWNLEVFIDELLHPQPEDQIALRNEGRFVAHLALAESDMAFQKKQSKQQQRNIAAPFEVQDHELDELQFSTTSTYLITGGLGGIGIALAQWMVEQKGVRHLVLAGRSAPTPEVLSILNRFERHGAKILVIQADISDQNQLQTLLETIQQVGLPLKGIIHAAGVLDDGVLVHLNWSRFAKVFGPKLQGSWNLHVLTKNIPLDFFAMFSSAASLVPAPGQANYAAANAFMDGLAHYRRSLGLKAVSINWGAWAHVGMTKYAPTFERRLEREGVQLIGLEQGMAAFEQILLDDPVQIAVLPIDWSYNRSNRNSPFFSKVVDAQFPNSQQEAISRAMDAGHMCKEMYSVRFQARPQILLEDACRHAKKVLGLDATAARFDSAWNLFELGMDSFMAVDLRNALQRETALSLPANLVFEHPTAQAIAAYLASHLQPPISSTA
ncbi:unnamed protein product [Calypogeia fissa]